MVVAVGDEGCQRVHVMRVLDNRNLVGLQEREEGLGTEARETVCTRLSLTGTMCSGLFRCNALSSPHNRPTEKKIIQEDERGQGTPSLAPHSTLHRCSEVPVGCSVLMDHVISMEGSKA